MKYKKKKKIKTTAYVRKLYAKHLNRLYSHAEGNFTDLNCYLCDAASSMLGNQIYSIPRSYDKCKFCPLPCDITTCDTEARRINLRAKKSSGISVPPGSRIGYYEYATPKSIEKHARWIEKYIVKNTDCEFKWVK